MKRFLPDEQDERIIAIFLVFDMVLTLIVTGIFVALTFS